MVYHVALFFFPSLWIKTENESLEVALKEAQHLCIEANVGEKESLHLAFSPTDGAVFLNNPGYHHIPCGIIYREGYSLFYTGKN